MNQAPVAESYVLLWTNDVAALADWSVNTLGLEESWRTPGESGQIEHAELIWFGSKNSINITRGDNTVPAGIALRLDDRSTIDALYQLATDQGATISQPLAESVVAYSLRSSIQTATNGGSTQKPVFWTVCATRPRGWDEHHQ